tara:strand:+ start:1317 stop:1814 length:498 start_codon:yes stop_codon:yes gene_type:complete
MAVVNLVGTKTTDLVATKQTFVDSRHHYGRVRSTFDVVTTNSDDSVNSTYHLARLPSNAVILPSSTIYFDDVGGSGAKCDIGVYAVDGNLVNSDDPDAINDGIAISSAGSASVIKDFATTATALWDYVASEEVDPGGLLDIKVVITDAAVDSAGQIALELLYVVD